MSCFIRTAVILANCTFIFTAMADETISDSAARLKSMRRVMNHFRMFELVGDARVELPLSAEPLSRYSDSARDYEDGTVWTFHRDGRPVVVTTCYSRDVRVDGWLHSTASLSENRLVGERDGTTAWSPESAGVKFRAFKDVPAPSQRSPVRRTQIRQLSRRFKAWQFWDPDNQRFELRLLARPIAQYKAESDGIVDGCLFLFTHGIAPELLLLIEAVERDGRLQWRYSFAKLGSAEFHASLDGEKVFSSDRAPGVIGRPEDPYMMFFSKPMSSE